ncbi:zinc metalloprotease HtpX [Nicoliella spurrieriana]|uniref:Protease HtpX homolog n=1 Tax=Nicoliella spurrieriana TaxID=2925830 RepID=A0A976X5L6_9LACO|nr:zinc metalloprotease HtpX [Nicoliella spurrieriana]UQS87058.1 zinc metalloprotease HtpX [Nicoliella spurrieriana]
MLYEQIAQNKRKTVYVLTGFMMLLLLVGAAAGILFLRNAILGVVIAAVVGVIYTLIMISQSIDVVMMMNHGHEITTEQQAPQLWHVVSDMAMVARVPMPRVFIIDDDSPNAFATGNNPKRAAVAVTTGLLSILNREELEGVIAHEVSHIRNYDIRVSTIGVALSAAISIIVDFGMRSLWFGGNRRNDDEKDTGVLEIIASVIVLLLGPLAATIAQMALSRNREYLADASGVELTRNPLGLINALQKIAGGEPMHDINSNSAGLYIEDPYHGKHQFSFAKLFDTHPPIKDRIQRLEKM